MRFHHVLALTASVGVASAKCKPRSSTALGSLVSSIESTSTLEPSFATKSSTDSETATSTASLVEETSTTASEESSATSAASEESSTTSAASEESSTTTAVSEESSTATAEESSTTSFEEESSSTGFSLTESSTTETATTSEAVSETSTVVETTPTPTIPPEPRQICQAKGSRPGPAFRSSTRLADNSFVGCRDLCVADSQCNSFSIEIKSGGACSLYDSLLYLDFQEADTGATIFFDSDCPEPVVEVGALIMTIPVSTQLTSFQGPTIVLEAPSGSMPTDSVPSGAGPVASFPAYTPPSVVSSDSPPYTPSGPRPTPSDDWDFVQTYTWTEYQLPTMVDVGRPPVTTGIALSKPSEMPCLLSAGAANPFTLLNEEFVPMVTRTGSVGPLLQPTEAPAPDDPILNPSTFTVPSFHLEAVSGVSDVYDMVYTETGQYVAMTTDGQVILVDASTGTSFNGDHVTSIFTLDCKGTISITQGGSKYTWSTQGESCSIARADTPKNNMKALPLSVPKVEMPDRKRAAELIETLKARGAIKARVNTDFKEPQCPNTPAGLVMKTKPDYEMGEGNFCEDLSEWWGLSPFDFDTACEIQSLCFDQCENFSFAGCVAIFSYSMYFTCAENFESWWDVIKAGACAAQASVFVGLAASKTGQDLYNKAQDSMCRCFCSDPPDTCVYLDDEGKLSDNFYCANLKGSDMINCGSCGGMCGANSACKSGVCGCPQDQCGTTCLDFRNNPNNCGACGNVCNPQYCVDGSCYAPKPGECSPDQAVTNNWFDVYSPRWANWTTAAFPGTTLNTDVIFSPTLYRYKADAEPVMAIGVEMKNLPAQGHHAMITQKRVKMCPKFNYELKFNMGFVNQVNGAGVQSNADCKVRWVTGIPSSPTATDGFRASPWYNIGASNPTWQTFGPWFVGNVREGEVGVTAERMNLYVDLTAVISCTTPVGGFGNFVLTGVEMNQVGIASKRSEELSGYEAVPALEQRDSSTNGTVVSEPLEEFSPGPFREAALVSRSVRSRHV